MVFPNLRIFGQMGVGFEPRPLVQKPMVISTTPQPLTIVRCLASYFLSFPNYLRSVSQNKSPILSFADVSKYSGRHRFHSFIHHHLLNHEYMGVKGLNTCVEISTTRSHCGVLRLAV